MLCAVGRVAQVKHGIAHTPMVCRPAVATVIVAIFLFITQTQTSYATSTAAMDWCDAHCMDKPYTAAEQAPHESTSPSELKLTLIVGCQKCGTTFLHAWLSRHPSVVAASTNGGRTHIKEVHYLDRSVGARSHQAYMSFWQHARDENTTNKYMFEASPSYMFTPCAACR
jgi:hypothetical protein